jgi:hypothetical protein
MTLVDDKGISWDRRGVNVICIEEVDELGSRRGGLRGWGEADVICCGVGGSLEWLVSSRRQ